MAIFYSETERSSFTGDLSKMDGTKAYLRHYDNYLTLDFISKATTDRRERDQALKELTICERKLEYWKRHPRYVHDEALRGIQRMKANWEKR